MPKVQCLCHAPSLDLTDAVLRQTWSARTREAGPGQRELLKCLQAHARAEQSRKSACITEKGRSREHKLASVAPHGSRPTV